MRGSDFTLVYDGGSNDDLARGPANRMLAYLRTVAPMLTTINYLILSHPHRDHVERFAGHRAFAHAEPLVHVRGDEIAVGPRPVPEYSEPLIAEWRH